MNGFICTPQLDFLIFRSDQTLYDSPNRESIPLRFEGLPHEIARSTSRVWSRDHDFSWPIRFESGILMA
jgi:hypothetical protein